MFTSSVTVFTLEVSREPCWTVPRPFAPGVPVWGEPLAAGVWGIREPKPEAAEVEPDILLVPLLAFDRAGHRIGYGAGYYDLTMTGLRARKAITAVGVAFADQ